MELINITKELRQLLEEYRRTGPFEISNTLRFFIRAIEIAVNLTELALENERRIQSSEEYWFEGEYLIDNTMTGEWERISILYKELVKCARSNGLFEK